MLLYPPFEQYQMEHPNFGYAPQYHMAYPPFEDPAYYGPHTDANVDPFAGYQMPQDIGNYSQQPYTDPFAPPVGQPVSQETQLYHFGSFAASIPMYNNAPPQMPPQPMYPPQASVSHQPSPMYPPQGYGYMPPVIPAATMPQQNMHPPRRPREQAPIPNRHQTMYPEQDLSAALRPRNATAKTTAEQTNQNIPNQNNSSDAPISDHIPVKEDAVAKRRSKVSYRKSSIVLICFFSVLCLISLCMLGYMLIPRLIAKSEYISLSPEALHNADDSFSFEDISTLFSASTEPGETQALTPELLAYYEQTNSDFIGWLDVPGTQIHYPVVRTSNNDYYLRHTFKKSYSDYGSIYADYRCVDNFTDANTVIYGHNMRNGTMFHDLTQMLDQDYLDAHNTFTITTPDAQVLTYQIFSAHEVHISTDYRTITLDGHEREAYFETLLSYSDVTTPQVEFSEDSRIVTFSTCPNDSDDLYRIAVHAVLIDASPLETAE